jgi:hypothetical protein
MAVITDIAEAVKDELNAGTFAPPFVAQRLYHPVFDLADMTTLHVTVVPKAVALEVADRSRDQWHVQVDIAVQKKYETDAPLELDPLMNLVQAIADFFRHRRLALYPAATWVRTENVPVYAQEHMEELRQFTSILTLTFRVVR